MTTVFSPGSIGNVGPGFDVLGLAVEGVGDRITVELTDDDARVVAVTGRDAHLLPLDALGDHVKRCENPKLSS